ncbi:hypothetical protein BCD_1481 (plasmid) [Borrelia crocidurae DOU]|uniref:Uncharacterized protein n=1 Tax=Borrelia crocidurae DOU TaxID=1293575 RepID=W5SKV2_9SPIR|nr:hypothetical protein [Borrelia crocidurae]AHH07547.1 hypothetical protein BCD_1481 [Borrelia crocidurae DOU]
MLLCIRTYGFNIKCFLGFTEKLNTTKNKIKKYFKGPSKRLSHTLKESKEVVKTTKTDFDKNVSSKCN